MKAIKNEIEEVVVQQTLLSSQTIFQNSLQKNKKIEKTIIIYQKLVSDFKFNNLQTKK
jgi:hypothetical protein